MTAPRQKCPTSDLTGDRHMVNGRRWMLVDPAGTETVLCSPCCVIMWASYASPIDAANSGGTVGPADLEPRHSATPAEGEAA